MNEPGDLLQPRARADFLAPPGFEARLAEAIDAGTLANGWLIVGGEGAGKATLAFRLARALLAQDRKRGEGLQTPSSSRTFSLVASGGHPDLHVAERAYDEKKERYTTEISIEVVRNLISFLSHTASMGGWRVAIVDTADDLNRNSANALLKVLEEPPPRTSIFVLTAAPGRLLATIRSRCRKITLKPLDTDVVAGFLEKEGAAKGADARRIAEAAGGRPGFALRLSIGDGPDAIEAVEAFLANAKGGQDVDPVAARLAGKSADGAWSLFQTILVSRLAADARAAALRGDADSAEHVRRVERLSTLFARGEAVNLDRQQIILAAGRAFADAAGP